MQNQKINPMRKLLFACAVLLCAASCNDEDESVFPGRRGEPLVAATIYTTDYTVVRTEYAYDPDGRITCVDRKKSNNGGHVTDVETYHIGYSGRQVRIIGSTTTTDDTGFVRCQRTEEYSIALNQAGRMVSGIRKGHRKNTDGIFPAQYTDDEASLAAAYDAQGLPTNFAIKETSAYTDETGSAPIRGMTEMQTDYLWKNGSVDSWNYTGRHVAESVETSKWHFRCTYGYTDIQNTTNTDFCDARDNDFPDILQELRLTGKLCPYLPNTWAYVSDPGTATEHSIGFRFSHEVDHKGRVARVTMQTDDGDDVRKWDYIYKE